MRLQTQSLPQMGLVDSEINRLTKILFLATVLLSVALLALKVGAHDHRRALTSPPRLHPPTKNECPVGGGSLGVR